MRREKNIHYRAITYHHHILSLARYLRGKDKISVIFWRFRRTSDLEEKNKKIKKTRTVDVSSAGWARLDHWQIQGYIMFVATYYLGGCEFKVLQCSPITGRIIVHVTLD